jgi:DNA-binding response OmpR family regulator
VTQQTTINALAILPSQEDRLRLSEIFRHSRWHLDLSECLKDARVQFNKARIGVVLTDCHLPDGGWKDVMHELGARHITAPPVIVAFRWADERLWAEVLNLCGHDVLATPFHADEVLRSISSAWRHWRDNCALSALAPSTGARQSHSTATSERANGGLNSLHIRRY